MVTGSCARFYSCRRRRSRISASGVTFGRSPSCFSYCKAPWPVLGFTGDIPGSNRIQHWYPRGLVRTDCIRLLSFPIRCNKRHGRHFQAHHAPWLCVEVDHVTSLDVLDVEGGASAKLDSAENNFMCFAARRYGPSARAITVLLVVLGECDQLSLDRRPALVAVAECLQLLSPMYLYLFKASAPELMYPRQFPSFVS